MAKIAAILTDMFEDSEFTEPVKAFRNNGHTVVTVGIEKGATVKGKKKATPVTIDTAVDDAAVNDFDALLIPGGYSADKLRVHENAVRFAADFMKSGKPVFTICHGPQLLITAKALEGRTLTGYVSIRQDLINAGANFKDEAVVVDGNLVTSRNPGDLPQFTEACLQKFA